jgi:diguanylate cyclase (GGDEF)-like protein/PAS domain S-box-containing protein
MQPSAVPGVRGRATPVGGLLRDPMLLALLAAGAGVFAWFGIGGGASRADATIFWGGQFVFDSIFGVLSWRVARTPGISRATRRFWRICAFAAVLFVAGDAVDGWAALRASTGGMTSSGTAQTIMIALGAACIVGVLLVHPVEITRRERMRFTLDAATIMAGTAMFLWHVLSGAILDDRTDTTFLLAAAALGLVCTFAMVKLLLGGNAPYTRGAGAMGGLAASSIALTNALAPAVDALGTGVGLGLRLLPCVLLAAVPRVQLLQMRAEQPARQGLRRPYSVLAYLTVGGAQILLVVALLDERPDASAWGVVVGAVLITGLVVIRQLTAFVDNNRLVAELDASVLTLRRHEQRLNSLMRYSTEISAIITPGGTFTYVNPAIEPILGLSSQGTVDQNLWDLLHPGDIGMIRDAFADLVNTPGATRTRQLRIRHADGSWRWLSLVTTNLLGDPAVSGIVCNARDITETVAFQARLRHEATHDPLTGLANRALLDERIRAAQAPDAAELAAAFLVIDLDDFKKINDTNGHHVGDAFLCGVADRLHAGTRGEDLVARLGGDEFALLLPGASAEEGARAAARILEAFAEPVVVDERPLRIRASIGVAAGRAAEAESLMRAADAAMYAAKQRGKDTFVIAPSIGTPAAA